MPSSPTGALAEAVASQPPAAAAGAGSTASTPRRIITAAAAAPPAANRGSSTGTNSIAAQSSAGGPNTPLQQGQPAELTGSQAARGGSGLGQMYSSIASGRIGGSSGRLGLNHSATAAARLAREASIKAASHADPAAAAGAPHNQQHEQQLHQQQQQQQQVEEDEEQQQLALHFAAASAALASALATARQVLASHFIGCLRPFLS